MKFVKMHGLGNDFVFLEDKNGADKDFSQLAIKMCAPHTGIGADGIIVIVPSDKADVRMRIINADGSEAEMCGNGIRCAAKFLYDTGLVKKADLAIDTLAGVKNIHLDVEGDQAVSVTVDMGEPVFEPARIPVAAESNRIRVSLGGREVSFFCVSMGNPHAVTFDLFPDEEDFRRFGREMECHPIFPAKANIEFCRVEDRGHIAVKVWERGDGPTLACGTGSCAVLAAAASLNLADRSADIRLPGGTLHDHWAEDGHIYMRGPAAAVANGQFLD